MPSAEMVLAARDLWKVFPIPGGSLDVLKGITFSPPAGKVTAVVGASGAGKSTLLHILGTLDRPTRGEVVYDDQDVFRWDDARLARFRNRSVGFIFQFHHLLEEFSALENVMLPGLMAGRAPERVREEATALLARVGLIGREGHRPGQLSGGEQQRVAVARALINKPRLVLADEPSGNLDRRSSDALKDLIFSLARDEGWTFVIVTHDERLAARADLVMLLEDGLLSPVDREKLPALGWESWKGRQDG